MPRPEERAVVSMPKPSAHLGVSTVAARWRREGGQDGWALLGVEVRDRDRPGNAPPLRWGQVDFDAGRVPEWLEKWLRAHWPVGRGTGWP